MTPIPEGAPASLLEALQGPEPVVTVELRPPRTGLDAAASMDAWIDMNHAVRRFTAAGRFVFLTDDAVGQREEENLGHLQANLTEASDPSRVIPFLTCKHSLEYCLLYAERATSMGLRTLVVLGGDRDSGPPRCLPHAYQLRGRLRERSSTLTLGGWANPHADPDEQARYLAQADVHAGFYLTQVVSHHSAERLAALTDACATHGCDLPGIAGIFHYRSANSRTLARLAEFFPVPAEALTREFEAGAGPEEITARSIRSALDAGARGVYVSNLGLRRPERTLEEILARV